MSSYAEQARRISGCRLTFFTDLTNAELRSNGAFVQSSISLAGIADESQPTLWQDKGNCSSPLSEVKFCLFSVG